jgi:hypothetical protein
LRTEDEQKFLKTVDTHCFVLRDKQGNMHCLAPTKQALPLRLCHTLRAFFTLLQNKEENAAAPTVLTKNKGT